MITIHRTNMMPNTPAEQQLLRFNRKRIETCKIQLEKTSWRDCMHYSLLLLHSRLLYHSVP
jgi:hypothetical protein